MKNALRKLLVALVCLILCVILSPACFAEAEMQFEMTEAEHFNAAFGVAVNAANFPDPVFRAFVAENYDTDGDSVLTDEEREAVTEMDIHGLGITNLAGIWEFFYLTTLNCSENNLRWLDVSDLPFLEVLYCQSNYVTEAYEEASEKPQYYGLEGLYPSAALKVLWCYNNNLSEQNLNLDICENLEYLNCSNNPLGSLDLSPVPHLLELRCNDCGLQEIDLSHTPDLCVLWCWSDIINVDAHYAVRFTNNISYIDLSPCPLLANVVHSGIRENYYFENAYFHAAFFDGESEVSVSTQPPTTLYLGEEYGEFVVDIPQAEDEEPVEVVAIDEAHFPDEAFRDYIIQNIDRDGNASLSSREINQTTCIRFSNSSSETSGNSDGSTLEGIEYFTSLMTLECDNNQLTSLNLSSNPELRTLSCSGNQLASLDLSHCPKLRDLYCSSNGLTSLVLDSKPELTSIHCDGNRLASLDLSLCPKLENVYCSSNSLTSLNLEHNPELVILEANNNQLSSLNVNNNRALTRLSCDSQKSLDILDIGDCPVLVNTYESGTRGYSDDTVSYLLSDPYLSLALGYTIYDISTGTTLRLSIGYLTVDASTVVLTDPSVSLDAQSFPDAAFREFLATYDTNGDGGLSALERYSVTAMDCSGQNIETLDGLEYFTRLSSLNCSNNTIGILDLRLCPILRDTATNGVRQVNGTRIRYSYLNNNLTLDASTRLLLVDPREGIAIDAAHFPDVKFRGFLSGEVDLDSDGILLDEEVRAVTSMDVSGRGITDLTGIGYFTELTTLNCSYNMLTALDVSGLTKLERLYCQNNYYYNSSGEFVFASAAASDGSGLTEAESFNAPVTSGGIETLIIGNAPLKLLWCYDNHLTALNLRSCHTLENLDCAFNLLDSLDVSGLPGLTTLMCHDNNLSILDVSDNPALTYLWCWNNPIQRLNISQCPKLVEASSYGSTENFKDHISLFNDEAEVSISHYTDLYRGTAEVYGVPVTAQYFPDEDFRAYLRTMADLDHDGVLSDEEIAALEQINCTGWGISSLEGINYLTGLKRLYCAANRLTELDVSGIAGLQELNCSYNYLRSLNVSGNAELRRLRAASNRLTELDLSGNPQLHVLWCWYNQIETLDVRSSPALYDLAINGIIERYGGESYDYYDENGEYHEGQTAPYICRFDKAGISDLSTDETVVFLTGNVIEINEKNFPDPNFRSYVEGLDESGDGSIDEAELYRTLKNGVDCSNRNIRSLKGVELFSGLTRLNCSGNQLEALDLSLLTSLAFLDCSGNQLITLGTWHNPDLIVLDCSDNSLSNIALSNNAALRWLDCSHNSLSDLNIVDCDTIKDSIKAASGTTRMVDGIMCYSEAENPQCEWYFGPVDLYLAYDPGVILAYGDGDGVLINFTNFPDPAFRYSVYRLFDTNCDGLLSEDEIAAATEINVSGLQYDHGIANPYGYMLEAYGAEAYDTEESLTEAEAFGAAAPIKHLSRGSITTLKGVEYLTSLQSLYCEYNQLTSLDLSSNTALQDLRCSNNYLTNLNLDANTVLVSLSCENNLLAELDLSHNSALRGLGCAGNHLTSLDLRHNPELEYLVCCGNSLTTLDISMCPRLLELAQRNLPKVQSAIVFYIQLGDYQSYALAYDEGDIVIPLASPDLILPAELSEIGEEAFAGGTFRSVLLSDRTVIIGSRAFADCPKLAYIYIPAKDAVIDPEAFENTAGLTIIGEPGSKVEVYAHENGFAFTAYAPPDS